MKRTSPYSFVTTISMVGILLNNLPFSRLVLANNYFVGSSDKLVSDIVRNQCLIHCNCMQAANPLFEMGLDGNQNRINVSVSVLSSCQNQNSSCLTKNAEFCLQEISNTSLVKSISYFDSLGMVQNISVGVLCLSAKNVTCLKPGVLEELGLISALIMDHNFIRDVSWINKLENNSLSYLDLSFNQVEILHPNMFRKTPNLIWLDLSHNQLDSIEANALENLKYLQLLDLSSNTLTSPRIYEKAFKGLVSLMHLSLANNLGLTKLPNFDEIELTKSRLKTLDLHGLYLQTIDSFAFSGLETLVLLNLSDCYLKKLNLGWLSNGPEKTLETLDLSQNFLDSIKSNYFVSFTLKKNWQHSMDDLANLDPKKLPYIVNPSVHRTQSDIYPINYQSCFLNSLKKELYQPLPNLTWLSVGGNKHLSVIEKDSFKLLPKLQYLFLQNCNINKLRLAEERHQFENNGIFATLPELKGVWVSGNPLNCDCHIRLLLEWSSTPIMSSHCMNYSKTEPKAHYVDASEYWYKDRCRKANYPGNPKCILGISKEETPITDIPFAVLTCPEEPVSILVILLIGPITFAISIGLIGICGFCAVTVRRLERHHSGFYLAKSFEQRNHASTKAHQAKKHKGGGAAMGSLPKHPGKTTPKMRPRAAQMPSSPRLRYKTNIVLDKLGEAQGRSAQSPLLGSFTPSSSPSMRPRNDSRNSQTSLTSRRHHHHSRPIRHFLSIPHHRKTHHSLPRDTTPKEIHETKFISSQPSS